MADEVMAAPAAVPQAAPQAAPDVAPQVTEQPVVNEGGNNESTVQSQSVDTQQPGQVESQVEPTNLEEAFKQLNAMESQAAQESVQKTDDAQDGSIQNQSNKESEQLSTSDSSGSNDERGANNDREAGDNADRSQQFNARSYVQTIENSVIKRSQMEAMNELQKAGVKMMDLEDITRRDEESGRISLINPDNGEPFADRVSAQTWLDTQNNQVRTQANKLATSKASELRKSIMPAVRTEVFKNTTYQTMDPITQNVFNELIDPYGVKNANGDVVGFDCDLDAMHQRAKSIVSQFNTGNAVAQVQSQATAPQQKSIATPNENSEVATPSVDMPSSSNGSVAEDPEPKTLEEALKIVYKNQERRQ